MIKALIVDDEALLRELFEQMLETQGYEVASAGNGEDAMEILKNPKSQMIVFGSNIQK